MLKANGKQLAYQQLQLKYQCMLIPFLGAHVLLSYYLWVGNTDSALCEAILFRGLEDRHTVLSILLHSIGATIRPVLVAHLLW